MNRTALYEKHLELGGKMVDFHGWEMPLHYPAGIKSEHLAVREKVGIFDVSHMGAFLIYDPSDGRVLQYLLTNDITNVKAGKCVYTHLPDEEARIIDDLIVTKISDDMYFCVPNASMIGTDREWIKSHSGVKLHDLSSEMTCLAVQGPLSEALLEKVVGAGIHELKKFEALAFDYSTKTFLAVDSVNPENMKKSIGIISGTGYTGENGYEMIMPNSYAYEYWDALLGTCLEDDIRAVPVGLGARDTLRLEMGYLLSGQDFNRDRTTLETNCAWVIKWDHDFMGRDILLEMKERKDYQKMLGILLDGRAPARAGSVVRLAESPHEIVGWVSSGNYSPTLNRGIALAYLDRPHIKPGIEVLLDYHGRQMKGITVKTPFVKK